MSGLGRGDVLPMLVGWAMADELLDRIAAADWRVRLLNREIAPLAAPTELWPPFPEPLLPLVGEAEVLLTLRLPPGLPESMPKLRWIHSQAAGIDYVDRAPGLLDAGVVITSSSGVHARPLSETVMGAIIALAKGFPQAVRRQGRREWLRYTPEDVTGKVVTIIGAGNIGTAIASWCGWMMMRTVGVRRTAPAGWVDTEPFERVFGQGELIEALSASDYVVLCAPRTPETVGMIGVKEFAAMKAGARFINVARGDLVDETALIAALESGHLGGAYLDVFATEPLPDDSPLWDMENVLITGHSGAGSVDRDEQVVEIFVENLGRYLGGRPLVNVYDHRRGY
ncbi:MAG: D-2-hydroxyacid dehydrogenase [Chloroflexi bacterium]|nr:D-2-hydroxyacid dehydrogenase [Chloroflexota bacterium]